MSFAGDSCLDTPHFKILQKRPMLRTRRNPSKRNTLLNIMPVSTDPGLSPSTSHVMSPISHRSSWSSASEFEQSPSRKSARQSGKINQLIKVNEAITGELADLESGKECWLKKLKLLEARICSNLVNIDKWVAENKSKVVSMKAANDHGYVGDISIGESPFSGSPSTWQLSLGDLASIFKGAKLEHDKGLPLEHLKDRAVFPFTDENLFYNGHEGSSPSSKKGNYGAHDPALGYSTLKGSVSLPVDIPISVEKGSTPSKQAKLPMDVSTNIGGNLPKDTSEAHKDGNAIGDEVQFGLDQVDMQDVLGQARQDAQELQQLKQHAFALEKEKSELESTLSGCKEALQKANFNSATLQMQKEELQTMLTDLKTSSESAQVALLKEKDDQGNKLLLSVTALEEAQQSGIVLERQKLVLQSELNYSKEVLEKIQKELKSLKKEKASLELEFAGCKQTLQEAQHGAVLLGKEKDGFAVQLSECKENLKKNQQHCLMLEKERDELRQDLAESKHALEEMSQKSSMVEREKTDLEAAHESLLSDLEKSEQKFTVLKNENTVLENALTKFKHALEKVQQQVMVLEGEKDDLKTELTESKHACKEAWQHAISLEEEKSALEIGACQCKEVLEETEQHVLTLQSALEGTLQRADALDHQAQRLRIEIKRLYEDNESLKALELEQESKCRELEGQREVLEAEMESVKSKKEAAEESMLKINALHASAMEDTKKETDALRQEHSFFKEESDRLKVLLEGATQRSLRLEADQKEMQERLKDREQSLQKVMQELDTLRAVHGNEVLALKNECVANEGKIQTLVEQSQAKCMELERLCKVENEVEHLREKLKDREVHLERTAHEFESTKAEMATKLMDLDTERAAKEAILLQEVDEKEKKVTELQKDLIMIRAEQTGLRGAMKDELVMKKGLMQKLDGQKARGKELEAALESAKLEQNNLLMDLENERLAKEAALEEIEAMKTYSEELEKEFEKLQADLHVMCEEKNGKQIATLQALHEEQSRSRELEEAIQLRSAEQEDAEAVLEDERDANEALMHELEKEQEQRMQLEEQLKLLRAEEEQVGAFLQEERAAMERLKKRLEAQEARCRELEDALNCARIEQDSMQMVLDGEATSKRAVMQELEEERSRYAELELVAAMKNETSVNAGTRDENLSAEVTELLAKSKKLEQLLSSMQRGGADNGAQTAVTQEVKELQSRIQDIELKLADAGYVVREGNEKSEDELLEALLQESPMFEQGAASSEARDDKRCSSSMDVARQTEEELRRLKESTEVFHQALFDAQHAAISDVAGLLAELKSLKQLLDDKTIVAYERKEEKRKGSMSLPTAALSTSALAAIGLLAFLKLPKPGTT